MKNKGVNEELWDNYKDEFDESKLMKAEILSFLIVMGIVAFVGIVIAFVNNIL